MTFILIILVGFVVGYLVFRIAPLEYLEPGPYYSISSAIASMCSDLRKHEETMPLLATAGILILFASTSERAARDFIGGFN